ncbi:hypothetical protein BBK82_14420 [Lentzea guizhouensis]|uniref:Uncharacterized protein n=1 Tax=Lentzea guizhouensis TaxID=1586287 RepID=A0A1B2HH82_9PSEU|nr:hypothetical protein [Lentzea guizhouensis]ANZ37084.1 hypothetical protein BBK82_14420 [Lentzea guizhouensis]
MDPDPDLAARLTRFNADLADGNLESGDTVGFACDLLVAGLDTPAMRELAGEPPVQQRASETYDLAQQMLVELGVELMDRERADWFLGREAARKVLAGAPRSEWDGHTFRITLQFSRDDDEVYWALARYDSDPEPFLAYAREYVRMADERLGAP